MPQTTRLTKPEARQRLAQLRESIDRYRYEYHVLDRPTISEAALDSLKHELTELESAYPDLITADSPSQRVAGKPLPGFTKVKHQHRMMSLADVFSVTELREWDERWRKLAPHGHTGYLADLKLDGLAMNLRYTRGVFDQAATRGDGFIGEDVTANVRTIEAVPLRLRDNDLTPAQRKIVQSGTVEIRGEVVMLKKDFERLNRDQVKRGEPKFANPRNVSAGSIRQLDPQMTASRKLSFFAWELVTDVGQKTLTESYALLKKMGVPVNPKAVLCRTLDDVIATYQHMDSAREQLPFWIDGVVVKLDDRELYRQLGVVGKTPRAAVAWKFAAEQATTVVESIDVQVGRTGALTPVAHLRPVSVAGTTVARATLHNADEVERLQVRVGDTIILQKAGDIIPEVVQVLLELRPKGTTVWKLPSRCPVCSTLVSRSAGEVIAYCPNKLCPARQREGLYHFVSKKAFDIAGLGPSTIDVLMDEGLVREPADLFALRAEDLIGLPLFADLKTENLLRAIEQAKKIRLDRCIYALGIRHVGEQTARDVAQVFSRLERFLDASDEELQRIPNIGSVVAKSISTWLHDRHHRQQVERLLKHIRIQPMEKIVASPLTGSTVVITGSLETMSRDEAEERVRKAGGKVSSSVSTKTAYVVVGDEPGSKAEKAKTLGVRILSEREFLSLLK